MSRFIRLYPMLFLGAIGGIGIAIVHNFTNPAAHYDYSVIAVSGALSLLALPYLNPDQLGEPCFSFNPPIWSLFFEIIANIFYCLFARHLSLRVLVAIVCAGLVGMVVAGPLGGGDKAGVLTGLPRVAAGFFGGVLLFEIWKAGKLPCFQAPAWALVMILLVLFMVPGVTTGFPILLAYSVLFLVVIAAINTRVTLIDTPLQFLGLISYPVYLIHWLTLYVFTFVGTKLGFFGNGYHIVAIVHLLATPLMGWLALKLYEEPVRKLLKAKLNNRSLSGSIPAVGS